MPTAICTRFYLIKPSGMFGWSVFIVLSLVTPCNVTESVFPECLATASQECLVLSLFLLSPPFLAILLDKLLSVESVNGRDNWFSYARPEICCALYFIFFIVQFM